VEAGPLPRLLPLDNLSQPSSEREFFIDNLLVRIHIIIVMIWWAGLADSVAVWMLSCSRVLCRDSSLLTTYEGSYLRRIDFCITQL